MKKNGIRCFVLVCALAGEMTVAAFAGEIKEKDCFFLSSLHATARGMAYWYDKANGGLETLTGIPYADLGCQNCHISSCDTCHVKMVNGKPSYSIAEAKNSDRCLSCHAREAIVMKIDREAGVTDVHAASGMGCMDCHTAREIHGDGSLYHSMKDPGAMDVTCEQCHDAVSDSVAHTVHGDRLDCKACHVRHVVSCTNCHFDTMVRKGKRVAIPVSGWKFLMNGNGKVTSANMQTFVVSGNKTFLMFAPQFSHSVKKEGDPCEACHAAQTVSRVLRGKIDLTWRSEEDRGFFDVLFFRKPGEKVEQVKGIIPVADGVQYGCAYQNFDNGLWTPIIAPAPPKVQYVGYGSPLTEDQLKALATPQKIEKKNK